MSKHLRTDLERLERQLLLLAGRVEDAVRRAVTSLLEGRIQLAEAVIDGDQEIDRREVELEEECLKILALHQPVANDLRFVAACLKIDNDLERIGDLASNIAERAIASTLAGTLQPPDRFREMVDLVVRMLRASIDAFVGGDAAAARRVCHDDQRVDDLNRSIIAELLETMRTDPAAVDAGTHMLSASKSLERIADHATNIAEDVVYMVRGDIIRHGIARGEGGDRPPLERAPRISRR